MRIGGYRGPLMVVLVNLRSGTTLRGALVDERRNALVLRGAAVANVGDDRRISWTGLDGDVVIPMENVDYYQASLDASLLSD